MTFLWVALGGAVGASLRYGVYRFFGPALAFPFATLLVNVLGSLLIGIVAGSVFLDPKTAPGARLFFQTGLLGSFTTFSAFSLETMQLWQSGQTKTAAVNVVLNVLLCLLAAMLGILLGSALAGRLR